MYVDGSGYGLGALPAVGAATRAAVFRGNTMRTVRVPVGPALEMLDVTGCGAEEIVGLGNAPRLTSLFASGNRLLRLDESMAGLAGLAVLKLAGSRLTSLPPFLAGLAGLVELDLSRNRLVDRSRGSVQRAAPVARGGKAVVDIGGLAFPASLERLSLAGNEGVEVIPSGVLALAAIRHLDVFHCRIAELPEQPPASLEELLARGNLVREVPEAFFLPSSLRVVDLRDNKVDRLPPAVWPGKRTGAPPCSSRATRPSASPSASRATSLPWPALSGPPCPCRGSTPNRSPAPSGPCTRRGPSSSSTSGQAPGSTPSAGRSSRG